MRRAFVKAFVYTLAREPHKSFHSCLIIIFTYIHTYVHMPTEESIRVSMPSKREINVLVCCHKNMVTICHSQ